LLLIKDLTASHPDSTRILWMLLAGGGALYFLKVGSGALERELARRARRRARHLLTGGGGIPDEESRRDAVAFLIGRDEARLRPFPWVERSHRLVGGILLGVLSLSHPRAGCHRAMARCLCLLEMGRAHWGLGRFAEGPGEKTSLEELEDERVLQLLLAVLVLLSALFRLHLVRWGMPSGPFARRPMARLRGSWFPFCALEPSSRIFPPPLPQEADDILGACDPSGAWLLGTLSSWIFWGDGEAFPLFVEASFEEESFHRGRR
jgi:hypothetical protein